MLKMLILYPPQILIKNVKNEEEKMLRSHPPQILIKNVKNVKIASSPTHLSHSTRSLLENQLSRRPDLIISGLDSTKSTPTSSAELNIQYTCLQIYMLCDTVSICIVSIFTFCANLCPALILTEDCCYLNPYQL